MYRAYELESSDVVEGNYLLRDLAREDQDVKAQASHRERVRLLGCLEPKGVLPAGLEHKGVWNKDVRVLSRYHLNDLAGS